MLTRNISGSIILAATLAGGVVAARPLADPAAAPAVDPTPDPAAHAQGQAEQGFAWEQTPDGYLLRFDDRNGAPVLDFLGFVQQVFDLPLQYDPTALADLRIYLKGEAHVSQADVRAFVENLLDPFEIAWLLRDDGTHQIVELVRRKQGVFRSTAEESQPVPLEELESWRGRRVLIRVVVPIEHLNAVTLMGCFTPLLDSFSGMVRADADANALILVGAADVVCRAVDTLRLLDVPVTPTSAREHAQRMADLEQRIQALEAR